jgi:hypothetical protein
VFSDIGGPLVVDSGENKPYPSISLTLPCSQSKRTGRISPSMFTRITEQLGFLYTAMVPVPTEYMMDYKNPSILLFDRFGYLLL